MACTSPFSIWLSLLTKSKFFLNLVKILNQIDVYFQFG
jgi:hypothetical protein